jgi:hypothetical protein
MTWDAQPDVDLYVSDPTEYFYGNNSVTPDEDFGQLTILPIRAGALDLTKDNVIRWGNLYNQAHYYDGTSPTATQSRYPLTRNDI